MKALRAIFVLALAASTVSLFFGINRGMETDLLGMTDSPDSGALREIASGMSGKGRILLEGADQGKLISAANRIAALCGNGRGTDFKAMLKTISSHKDGLLAPETRNALLKGDYASVAESALARLYGPIPPLFSIKEDPFLLATEYVTSLQSSLAPGWTLKDGYPIRETNGKHSLVFTVDLSSRSPREVLQLMEQISAENKDGVSAGCGGAPFHSSLAAEKSKREINLLSALSIAAVLLCGWLLFRSFAFIPELLMTLAVGGVFAAGILFAVFPRPHVLTFVFGTSLIGLSVDYIYHARASGDARRILKPLTASMATTVACFVPLLLSDVAVLRQMAVFTSAGLLAAYAAVVIFPRSHQPIKAAPCSASSVKKLCLFILLGGTAIGLFRLKTNSNPATFYRPDPLLVQTEKALIECNPAGNSNRFAYVKGETLQECLEREEEAGIRGMSALIPSLKRQRENAELVKKLFASQGKDYTAKTGLRMPSVGDSFLDPEKAGEELMRMIAPMRLKGGIISPCNATFKTASPHVAIFEPKRELEDMFARFTASTLKLLGFSLLAFAAILTIIFKRRVMRYAIPVICSLAATAGTIGWLSLPVTFFTMLCFFVLIGLGIDYTIFRQSQTTSDSATARTVKYSFLTSLAGLGMLAFTSFPVTFSMGVVFAIGLSFAWLFSEGFAKGEAAADSPWYSRKEQSAGHIRLAFMWWVYSHLGKDILKIVIVPVMAFIYPFAAPAKASLRRFYASLPGKRKARLFRHLLGFAWSLADKTDACTLKKNLPTMSVRQDASWQKLQDSLGKGKGAFIVTTHLGTAEVLPALGSGPHVHAFQQMSHNGVFTSMFMRHFDSTGLTLHAVEDIGVETACAMQQAIGRGELVMMAGDRVPATGGKTLSHDFLGKTREWPKGVFVFAKLMEAPIYFVTCVRTGWNAYEVHFAECNAAENLLDQYAAFLERETIAHPEQWYNFE